jgi:cytidylate kinase
MNSEISFERCLNFINCQLQPPHGELRLWGSDMSAPAVTISRQAGSGGHSVAERLAEFLQAQAPGEVRPWTVFDRNLVERVLEDHHLPNQLARFMPEDRISEINDTMDELFGLHPPSWLLVRQTSETVLKLARLGNAIIIGRGATVITRRMHNVFHVRLVGSLEKRIENWQQRTGCTLKEARHAVRREDLGRQRYLKKYFNWDIDDPQLYHLVINTDLSSFDQAARLIGQAVLERYPVSAGNREALEV